ncbi:tRNA lysidine(34) synthetase TilS [Gallibacterium trehalosifermentans]|uniref:tRNA(Ile)-lysidine synthase n=1 Tax=Gallibacterium trehalosifermentans TaxID=516935 RepID=A0ABV6GY78_9PAST
MNHLLDVLIQQIAENALQNKAFLIGFSGGVDSTALLHLFAQLRQSKNIPVRAIHIHHGLSKNADDWLQHCEQICSEWQIPFISQKVLLNGTCNIEAEARAARYQAIQQVLQPNEVLVTAHHLDDQCETFLLALKRGSGVKGLAAMPVQTTLFSVPIFRPLLTVSRTALAQYITEHQLITIFDESNDDTRYERNFLRKQVLPVLKQRWQHFDQAVARSAQLCAEQEQLLQELLTPIFLTHLAADGSFTLDHFSSYSISKQRQLLRLWLAHLQQPMPSQTQLEVLLNEVVNAEADRQPELQLNARVVRRFQHKLYLTPLYQNLRDYILPIQLDEVIELPDHLGEVSCQQAQQFAVFAWQQHQLSIKLPENYQQLTIRFHYSKSVQISAHSTKTEIKKVWQKLNVPAWQRTRIPLVFIDEHCCGAIGYFINYAEF